MTNEISESLNRVSGPYQGDRSRSSERKKRVTHKWSQRARVFKHLGFPRIANRKLLRLRTSLPQDRFKQFVTPTQALKGKISYTKLSASAQTSWKYWYVGLDGESAFDQGIHASNDGSYSRAHNKFVTVSLNMLPSATAVRGWALLEEGTRCEHHS